jgi:formiminotetrahydrofolate cyclodeaminase
MQQLAKNQNLPVPLYSLSFRDLLAAFGAGKPTPGSGAAAAATGAFACELVSANAKITVKLSKSAKFRTQSEYVEEQLALKRPILAELTQMDNDLFGAHIKHKNAAKKSKVTKDRRRHSAQAKTKLEESTVVLLRIAKECLAVARLGLVMMDIGFEPARGDAVVGVSNAVAGANGSLCVAMVNITSARRTKSPSRFNAELQEIYVDMLQVQKEQMQRVVGMKEKVDDVMSGQLDFF